jgi:F1F0 ATPase subunit 2
MISIESLIGAPGPTGSSGVIGALGASLALGMLLGSVFFGGLWWTVQRGLVSNNPALWFGLSTLGRMAAVLVGFYFVAQSGTPSRVLACLLGLLIARFTVTRLTRVPRPTP